MDKIRQLVLVGLLSFSGLAHAVAFLNFYGDFGYDANTGVLSIDAQLTDWADSLSHDPIIATDSQVNISTTLQIGTPSLDTATGQVTATFGADSDISVINGGVGAETLLLAEILSATFSGNTPEVVQGPFGDYVEGGDAASLDGLIQINGGLLDGDFSNPSNLYAFTFNLQDTLVSETMFDNSFSGLVNGKLEAIPEPSILVLLATGLIGLFLQNRKKSIV